MADSAYRQILMLRRIPSFPRKVSVSALHDYLVHQEGFEVTKRTVERDLVALSSYFDLVCDKRDKPYGWSFSRGSLQNLPIMDINTAIAFDMVGKYLREMLPLSVISYLKPYFENAEKHLAKVSRKPGDWWSSRFASLPEGLQLVPAKISTNVLEIVYQGVLEGRKIEITRQKGKETVNPLGIVHRGRVVYLVAQFEGYDDIRQVSLQRIASASLLNNKIIKPKKFNLREYIDGGAFSYGDGSGKQIKIQLKFEEGIGLNLYETPL